MPQGIVQNFWTPGSAQGSKFGAQREQIAALNFVPFWCPYKFLFSLNTDSTEKNFGCTQTHITCTFSHLRIWEFAKFCTFTLLKQIVILLLHYVRLSYSSHIFYNLHDLLESISWYGAGLGRVKTSNPTLISIRTF